ncbi:MAG: extracellular solute-binding protein [Puniceicoccales bacterium]|jgi:ABC-type Fe3+ transport system substrate-binding protein|nr:extracellular solute-binding protein [Puniceicoccales bacterium]
MVKKLFILTCVALIVAIPFIFRRLETSLVPRAPDDVIVIITAHNETLRSEYGRGFSEWYRKKTGKIVTVDWRHPGGGRDVARYIDSMFLNNFRQYWEKTLGNPWTQEVRTIFSHLESVPGKAPEKTSKKVPEKSTTPLEHKVRQAFLDSNVSCNIDLLFGGGVFDHKAQCAKGYTVPCGLIQSHPEWFTDATIPEFFAGERLWDAEGRWVGGSLSTFGIIYNSDAVAALGIEHPPATWMDFADPRYINGIAIVDPTKSSSTLKSYEMLIQQQMQILFENYLSGRDRNHPGNDYWESLAIKEGWIAGLQLIQKIVANGHYVTDSSAQTVLDVADGNCPVGIATDFYGRAEKANIENRGAKPRFHFVIPRGGCSPSPDPISLYRGAKHRELALEFLEYVLTVPGQSLLAFKVGAPNGPTQTPICRTPILKTMYSPEFLPHYNDPDVNPYDAGDFVYREDWTKPVFDALGFIFKIAFLEPEAALRKAWRQIQKARKEGRHGAAERALAVMEDLSMFDYGTVAEAIMVEAKNKDYLRAIRYQTAIAKKFREQYEKACKIAKER